MAWQYADYDQYTGTTKLDRLRLHVAEVRTQNGAPEMQAGDFRIAPNFQYLRMVEKKLEQLEAVESLSALPGGGRTRIRFRD